MTTKPNHFKLLPLRTRQKRLKALTMVLRHLASKILVPNLERDLSKTISKEVNSIDELMFMAGRVFSYQTAAPSTPSAFARTSARQAPAELKLVRVERPVTTRGLFHD